MTIAFVGDGSLTWGTMVLTNMALNSPLHGATIAMQDTNQAALDLAAHMGRTLSAQAGAGFRVETATALHAAVADTDVAVDYAGLGGLEAMQVDLEVPARYDVIQPVGCTVGPGEGPRRRNRATGSGAGGVRVPAGRSKSMPVRTCESRPPGRRVGAPDPTRAQRRG